METIPLADLINSGALDDLRRALPLNVTAAVLLDTGVEAPVGTGGMTTDTPPQFFNKIGDGDTDWDLVLTVGGFGSPTGSGILSFDESGNLVLLSEIDGGGV